MGMSSIRFWPHPLPPRPPSILKRAYPLLMNCSKRSVYVVCPISVVGMLCPVWLVYMQCVFYTVYLIFEINQKCPSYWTYFSGVHYLEHNHSYFHNFLLWYMDAPLIGWQTFFLLITLPSTSLILIDQNTPTMVYGHPLLNFRPFTLS